MTTLAVGLTIQHERADRRRLGRGYGGNRERYDARRRAHTRTQNDKAFWAIVKRDPCGFCGAKAVAARNGVNDVDHIVHLDAGGEDGWENYGALCPGCNRGVKRDRGLLEAMLLRSAP